MPKRPQYTKEELDEALKTMATKTMSLREIAKKYKIPRATLQYKLKNPRSKSTFGPTPYLTQEEEDSIEQWLITMSRKGFPRKSDGILDTVQRFLINNPRDTPFTDNRPGQGWLRAFLKRHPNISQITNEEVSKAGACVSKADIKKWFNKIGNYLTNESLLDVIKDPQRIFNAGETVFQSCPSTGRVLVHKNDINVCSIEQGNSKENITALFTFSADGKSCPPLIVFPYKTLPDKVITSVPPNWGIGRDDTGSMTSELFNTFITEIFSPYLIQHSIQRPVILFIDGHKSHVTLQLNWLCKELGIELIALYPSATPNMQPSEVSIFGLIKKIYKEAVKQFQTEHIGKAVTKQSIATILKIVLDDINPDNVREGFRASGLYPFDENSINYTKPLATSDNIPVVKTTEKLMSFEDFGNIIGEETLKKINILQSMNIKINDNSPLLYKFWHFFKGDSIPKDVKSKEKTDIDIQPPNNTTTNITVINNNKSITTLEINVTPSKKIGICIPSTSKETPRFRSVDNCLKKLPKNSKKFMRNVKKNPHVIIKKNR